jgi:putative copper resistance protein D
VLTGVFAHAGPGDLPPPLTWTTLLTEWTFQPLAAIGVAAVAVLYLGGVRQLRARGDHWSGWRTFWFVGAGLGSIVLATQSALAAYDTVLLSVHMVQHMVLNMVAPIFLALGAPVTLALRTLSPRPRGWLLAALHSRVARVLTFPLVAAAIFVAQPWVLYYTGLYEATLRNPVLHDLNHLHFLLVGCLWFWVILGLDPLPHRVSYPMRMLAVFATLPFHAWLGVTIMSASTLIAPEWYFELGRDWGPSPMADQRLAGGILWASGELIGLGILGVLFVQWMRESEREARREDRRLDREAAARAAQASGMRETAGAPEPDEQLWTTPWWERPRR